MPFFAAKLAEHACLEVVVMASAITATLLESTSEATIAASTASTGIVVATTKTTLSGHVRRGVLATTTQLHALLKARQLGEQFPN